MCVRWTDRWLDEEAGREEEGRREGGREHLESSARGGESGGYDPPPKEAANHEFDHQVTTPACTHSLV